MKSIQEIELEIVHHGDIQSNAFLATMIKNQLTINIIAS